MIADWSVDIGPDSPSIDVPWEGWVDLRWDRARPWNTEAVRRLAEVSAYPELEAILKLLNSGGLLTSKVDVFALTRDEADPEIAEAGEQVTRCGLGSYLDLLATGPATPANFRQCESFARQLARQLGRIKLPGLCSAEVLLRPARVLDTETFGWTIYATGFGADRAAARQAWQAALVAIGGEVRRTAIALRSRPETPGTRPAPVQRCSGE